MKLEEISTIWAKDANIDLSSMVSAAANVPKLHAKYYQILIDERLLLIKLKQHQEALELILEGFFAKTLTQAELTQHGLIYGDKKVLRQDMGKHIAVHPKTIEITTKIAVQSEKVRYIEDILKQVHTMNYTIKNIIDMKKFEAGL
jgi:3D (Asp-Asp-Asp) domain-containing protein